MLSLLLLERITANDPTLQTIALSNNKINDEDAKNLSEALEYNTTLRLIDLSNNRIGACV